MARFNCFDQVERFATINAAKPNLEIFMLECNIGWL
jgi:hypothetical protein